LSYRIAELCVTGRDALTKIQVKDRILEEGKNLERREIKTTKLKKLTKSFLFVFFAAWFVSNSALGGVIRQERMTKEEGLLSQADKHYQKGEYNKATSIYLKVASSARRTSDLSRAYFGLSLSFFYRKDYANAEKWIRKVLELSPRKEISVLFYPRSFVQLFYQIKERVRRGNIGEDEEKKQVEMEEQLEGPIQYKIYEKAAKPEVNVLKDDTGGWKEGKWEIDIHYSFWTIDPILSAFEDSMNKELEEELSEEITKQIEENHLALVKADYEQNLVHDSGGSNFGLEFRFYPKGKEGSFSLGLSFERTKIRYSFVGIAKQKFTDGSYGDVDAEGLFESSLFSTNLSFRWDMKPAWRVSPYFVFGFGLAPLKGEFSYSYTGRYYWVGPTESIEDSDTKTIKEIEEDIENNIPNIFPIIQMNFGVRGEIVPSLHLKAEAGIWDGFIFRFGLAYRF